MGATEAGKLLQLQQLDIRQKKLQQQLELPASRSIADKAELGAKQALQKLKKAEDALAALHKQVRSGELSLATVNAEIKDAEAMLYGGAVTNSRELGNIEHKLASAREKRGIQEEDLLNAMEEQETLQAEATRLRQQATQLTGEYKTAQAIQSEELKRLRNDIEQVSSKRGAVVAAVEPFWLSLYERLTQKRTDVIAELDGASCGACHVEQPPALVQQANAGIKPTYCESCGRLLCVP
jgi:predicted  nucleic acid-binding Zn-ribbon protein